MPSTRGTATEQGVYAQWMSQSVVLQVKSGEMKVSLRGVILGEMKNSIRFRVDDSWDIDIYKHLVLAVEEAECWMDIIT